MEPSTTLANWVAIWTAAAGLICLSLWHKGTASAGLVIAYVVNLALIHWLGAAIYLLPWYAYFDVDVVQAGFEQSTYAIVAFGAGTLILTPLLRYLFGGTAPRTIPRAPEPNLPKMYVAAGLVCFLGLLPIVGRVPTATAILYQGWNLLTVGLGLACWQCWRARKHIAFALWLSAIFCLPLYTIVSQGFLGYGTVAATAVVALVASFYRPKWRVLIAAILLSYLGISGYVSYMRDRSTIRDVVWGGESLSARVGQVYQTFSDFEWFDPYDRDQLERIDTRLNQNYLVGISVRYLESGLGPFAYGETLQDALIALIPRVIWPDKPVVAGSSNLVTRHTGISFAVGTSVGIGNVMEFYINFGTPGVVVGFLTLGVVIATVDRAAGRCLRQGDWRGFVLWFLPGLSFLQVGGSLVEITSSVGAALVMALLLNQFLGRGQRRRLPRRWQDGFQPSVSASWLRWPPVPERR